jgi:hypothetical protein
VRRQPQAPKNSNKAKFGCILTKIKDFGVTLQTCGKGGPSGSPRFGEQGARHMTDSTEISQLLAGLLQAEATDAFDWDASALADWPNIAPVVPATTFTAEPQAGGA